MKRGVRMGSVWSYFPSMSESQRLVSSKDSSVPSRRFSGQFRSIFTLPTMVLRPVASMRSIRSSVASRCLVAKIQALAVALNFIFSAKIP